MEAIESTIAATLKNRIKGAKPAGIIKCDVGEGVCGFTGSIETGRFLRRKNDILASLNAIDPQPDFSELLMRLREASRARPEGPFYRCNITIDCNDVRFRYFWENVPFTSVKELEPDLHGRVPHFVFAHRFDEALVKELTDFDVNTSLLFYIPARFKAHKPVSDPLLEVYATLEWQSDVNNGSMDQYFARDMDPMTSQPRSLLYEKTLKGLTRIGHDAAASVFADSVALYAHFYPRVEVARSELNIPAVPRQEQSNIMGRYYELERSLDPTRVEYVRKHIRELEQG